MEALKELYEEFKAEAVSKKKVTSKADKIRVFVYNLSVYLGESTLCFEATYNTSCVKFPCDTRITKAYFKQVVSKEWKIEKDDEGVEWIHVNSPWRKR